MNSPTCAVIMPHYSTTSSDLVNTSNAVSGLFRQTSDDWVLIAIDDASPFVESLAYLRGLERGYPNRIVTRFRDANTGAGDCRNIGITIASSMSIPIIVFNDSDDISHPARIERTIAEFSKHSDVDVIYSSFIPLDENGFVRDPQELTPSITSILVSHRSFPPEGPDVWKTIGVKTGYTNLTSCTSVRTELAARCPFPVERVSEDAHTWMRYSAFGRDFMFVKGIESKYLLPTQKRGSSVRERVGDSYYQEKARVDEDGFRLCLVEATRNGTIGAIERKGLWLGFLLKMADILAEENEVELEQQYRARARMLTASLEGINSGSCDRSVGLKSA